MAAPTTTLTNLLARATAFGYGTVDEANMTAFLNLTYLDVCARRRWTWLENIQTIVTVAGSDFINLPADVLYFGRLRPLTDADGPAPRYVSEWAFDELVRHGTARSGKPAHYSLFGSTAGQQIRLTPKPDAVYSYRLRAYLAPTAMTTGVSTTLIPDTFANVLVYGAMMHMSAREKNPQAMQLWSAQYESAIRDMAQRDKLRQREVPAQAEMPAEYGGEFDRVPA